MKGINIVLVSLLILGVILACIPTFIMPQLVCAASNTWNIVASTDDAGGRLTVNVYWDTTWTVNPAGGDSPTQQYYSGMRYQNINIPQGATITEAHITFTCGISGFSGTGTRTRFSADDTDDAATFSTAADYTTRWNARTTAEVDWDSPTLTAWVIDSEYQSPDLSSIIQEIVDRPGWTSGNAIAIFWGDREDRSTHVGGNRRYAYTYDSDPTKTPELYIAWEVAPTVVSYNATGIGATTATGHGNITDIGSDTVTTRGFQWGLSPGSYSTNVTEDGSFGVGAYSLPITGLPTDSDIYYRAMAYNGGWGYGSEFVFHTSASSPPTVTTGAITGFGGTWAVGTGTITDVGSSPVTQVGIDYGLTDAYGSSRTESVYITSGQGFSVRIDGLSPATQYHWRVKAYNGEWEYGEDAIFHTSGSDTLYEYFNTGDDADVDIYENNWFGQTFTTSATVPHTITQVRLRLFRVGSPGTLTAQIYRTSAGVPTGQEIGTGDIDGDTLTDSATGAWYTITLDEEVALQAETMYAITLDAKDGDASNYVSWRYDNGNGYADGTEVSSTDGGTTWSTVGANDMMFEVWGNPALQILDCKVFGNLLEDGDQLFIYSYQVIPPSAYDDTLSLDYFHTQLLVSSTLEAQAKLPAWGYKPGGFYLSADEALPWGINQTAIKIVGITGGDFAGDEAEYILTGTDWVGEDLNTLDDWIITTANAMGTWYGLTLTGVSSEGHYFLNPDGTVLFIIGIPGLEDIRPGMFSIQGVTPIPEEGEFDTSYAEGLVGGLGERWDDATEEIGDLVGVSGELVGGTFWIYVVVLGLALGGTVFGSGPIALICAGLPLAFLGGSLGAVPLEYILLPVFVLGVFAILKLVGLKP